MKGRKTDSSARRKEWRPGSAATQRRVSRTSSVGWINKLCELDKRTQNDTNNTIEKGTNGNNATMLKEEWSSWLYKITRLIIDRVIYIFKNVHGVCQRNVHENMILRIRHFEVFYYFQAILLFLSIYQRSPVIGRDEVGRSPRFGRLITLLRWESLLANNL